MFLLKDNVIDIVQNCEMQVNIGDMVEMTKCVKYVNVKDQNGQNVEKRIVLDVRGDCIFDTNPYWLGNSFHEWEELYFKDGVFFIRQTKNYSNQKDCSSLASEFEDVSKKYAQKFVDEHLERVEATEKELIKDAGLIVEE